MFSVRGSGVDGDLEVVHQSTPEPSLRLWEFDREEVLLQPVELRMQKLDEGQVEVGEEERSVRRGMWEILAACERIEVEVRLGDEKKQATVGVQEESRGLEKDSERKSQGELSDDLQRIWGKKQALVSLQNRWPDEKRRSRTSRELRIDDVPEQPALIPGEQADLLANGSLPPALPPVELRPLGRLLTTVRWLSVVPLPFALSAMSEDSLCRQTR